MEAKAEAEVVPAAVPPQAGTDDAIIAAGGPPPLPPPLAAPIGTSGVHLDLSGQANAEGHAEVKPEKVGSPTTLTEVTSPSALSEASLKAKEDQARHTLYARQISVFSLVASFTAAFLGLGIGFAEETLSVIGFGLECLLDALSSALVLWRFKKPKQREHQSEEVAARFKAARDARRERNSSLGIGATFVASAALLLVSAAYKLLSWDPHDEMHLQEEKDGANYSVMLSVPSSVLFGVLALAKFRLSRLLASEVLQKDALCSLLGAILGLICSLAGIIEEASGNPDKMVAVDSAASAVIAVILLVEGSRTLWHNLAGSWREDHRQIS